MSASSLTIVSAFANNPEKVNELKRKLECGEPLNEEELQVQRLVEEFKVTMLGLWKEIYGKLLRAVRTIFNTLSSYFSGYSDAKSVLTPRQYHLMLHGKPKVRKKWYNEAKRRLSR